MNASLAIKDRLSDVTELYVGNVDFFVGSCFLSNSRDISE